MKYIERRYKYKKAFLKVINTHNRHNAISAEFLNDACFGSKNENWGKRLMYKNENGNDIPIYVPICKDDGKIE